MAKFKLAKLTKQEALDFISRFSFTYCKDGMVCIYNFREFDESMLKFFKWRNVNQFINKKISPLYSICKALDEEISSQNLSIRLQELASTFIPDEEVKLNEFQIYTLNELFNLFYNKDMKALKDIANTWDDSRYDDLRLYIYAFAYDLTIPFNFNYHYDYSGLFKNLIEFYRKPEKVKVSDLPSLMKKELKTTYSEKHIRNICKELNLETTKDVGRPKY